MALWSFEEWAGSALLARSVFKQQLLTAGLAREVNTQTANKLFSILQETKINHINFRPYIIFDTCRPES